MAYALLAICSIGALVFFINILGFTNYSFFAPKVEQVRFDTFKQSQSYNDGMLRDLQELQLQYTTANTDQKVMLKAIVLHRFSVYQIDKLPLDLQSFYYSIK